MADLRTLTDQVNQALEAKEKGTPGAHDELLTSISKLQRAALGSSEYLIQLRYAPVQNACLVLAAKSGMLQAVTQRRGSAVTATEISQETGVNQVFVKRIMRMLTVLGVCDELGQSAYKANDVTYAMNQPGYLAALYFISGPTMKNLGNARSFLKEKNFPMFGSPTSFEYAHGAPLWDHLREDPEMKHNFDLYMSDRNVHRLTNWFDAYPAASLLQQAHRPNDDFVAIVDVGGGRGNDIANFRKQYPEIPGRFVLQDLPETFSSTAYVPPRGIDLQPYNFFTPQPTTGAQIYYFHCILHDWPDEKCCQILSNTAQAMNQESVLLIHEIVLPTADAGLFAVTMDILMMFNVAGIERSADEWRDLLEIVGLEIIKIWPSNPESVIETRLKR